jgi:TonB family protein
VMLHPRGSTALPGGVENSPATVTVENVNLRRDASPASAVVIALAEGARVRVTADRGRWLEVETDASGRGFVQADAVERDGDRDARLRRSRTLFGFAPVFGVVGEDTDVVLAPYPLAPRAGRLTRGTVIPIHSVDHSYFAFRDKKWGLAYVVSAQVDLVPPDPRQPAIEPDKMRPLKDLTIVNLEGEPPPEEELEAGAGEGEPQPPASAGTSREGAASAVEPAAVLKRVEPVYPELPRRAGIEGTVELEVSIDASGKLTDVEVVRGLPLGLSEAATDAVRRWSFQPARGPNGPISSRKTVRIRFALSPAEAP